MVHAFMTLIAYVTMGPVSPSESVLPGGTQGKFRVVAKRAASKREPCVFEGWRLVVAQNERA